jgi:hypothetical protein
MTQKDPLEVVPPFIAQALCLWFDSASRRGETPVSRGRCGSSSGWGAFSYQGGRGILEPDGDVIHYTVVNLLADGTSRFVVVMRWAPGVEMITMVAQPEGRQRRPRPPPRTERAGQRRTEELSHPAQDPLWAQHRRRAHRRSPDPHDRQRVIRLTKAQCRTLWSKWCLRRVQLLTG